MAPCRLRGALRRFRWRSLVCDSLLFRVHQTLVVRACIRASPCRSSSRLFFRTCDRSSCVRSSKTRMSGASCSCARTHCCGWIHDVCCGDCRRNVLRWRSCVRCFCVRCANAIRSTSMMLNVNSTCVLLLPSSSLLGMTQRDTASLRFSNYQVAWREVGVAMKVCEQ